MFLYFIGRVLEHDESRVHAMTLMSNHVHLLLTPRKTTGLADFVKPVAQRYTQLRNEKRNASGKLFEERFWSRPVLDEMQVAIVTAYIHANPIRSGQVKDASDYRWSTHALHAGLPNRCGIPVSLWTPTEWYLRLGRDYRERSLGYVAAFDDYLSRDVKPERVRDIDILEAIAEQRQAFDRRPDRSRAR
jgi:putative transposase